MTAQELNNLSFKFFRYFARMECALKQAGYFSKKKGYVSPDWGTFADDIDGQLHADANKRTIHAIRYYTANPPGIEGADKATNRVIFVDAPVHANPTREIIE